VALVALVWVYRAAGVSRVEQAGGSGGEGCDGDYRSDTALWLLRALSERALPVRSRHTRISFLTDKIYADPAAGRGAVRMGASGRPQGRAGGKWLFRHAGYEFGRRETRRDLVRGDGAPSDAGGA